MSEMVERVARAIAKGRGHDPEKLVVPGTPYLIDGRQFASIGHACDPSPLWQFYVLDAKSMIEAMREPTKAMLDAADDVFYDGAHLSYPKMIDGALK